MKVLIDGYFVSEEGKVFSLDREEAFYSKKEIASVYKVTYDCIWRISKGFNWSHVTNIRKEAINASSH